METAWIVLIQLVLLHTVTVAGCLVDVALKKPASMHPSVPGYTASTAVDGNTDADGYGTYQIIYTGKGDPAAWWKVDLQREVQDATVRIYFRTDYKWRRNGVKLYTSTSSFPNSNPSSQGQLCQTVTENKNGSDIPDVYNVTCPGRWRYLLLYTDTDNDGQGAVLDLGEVEVLVCSDGTYGEDCTKTFSSRKCVTMTTCERDGRCPDGCQSGWTGVDCTQECPSGFYGTRCNRVCGNCSPGPVCDHVTGSCQGGCKSGWSTNKCDKECVSGQYGVNCAQRCGQCNGTCDHVFGHCPDGCLHGFCGLRCDVKLEATSDVNIETLIGTLIGTTCLVLLLVSVVLLCLTRHGRLQWVKRGDKKQTQMSRDSTQMSNIAQQPAEVSEHAHQSSNMHSNDYDVLDPEKMPGNKEYDVIQHKEYENV